MGWNVCLQVLAANRKTIGFHVPKIRSGKTNLSKTQVEKYIPELQSSYEQESSSELLLASNSTETFEAGY
jgi:hypothetical protein